MCAMERGEFLVPNAAAKRQVQASVVSRIESQVPRCEHLGEGVRGRIFILEVQRRAIHRGR